ncbi:MAG: histone deacetylase [Acidobacteriota bacterium]
MLPFKLIYHDRYDLNLGDHIFPARKYRLIRERLLASGIAEEKDFLAPCPARDEDILLVHEAGWVKRLRTGTLEYLELLKLELPYSRQMVEGLWLAAGGTLLASQLAMCHGAGVNLGGGFHHAFAAHGEGFCAIHDVAVAVRTMQREGRVRRVLIVDCDVHQGNGTAAIFAGDDEVFTFSIHQRDNYPYEKPPSHLDVNLDDGTGDEEYLRQLDGALERAVEASKPELIQYVAGADPFLGDQLGGLNVSREGLRARDRMVFEWARRAGAPVAITLAGGYAEDTADTVAIHCATVEEAGRMVPG